MLIFFLKFFISSFPLSPSFFKLPDVTPIFEKGSKNSKDNYRCTSILNNLLNIFEKVMYKQMTVFLDKFQRGFRKVCSIQQCLIILIQKWNSTADSGKYFGTLLTHLSKVFNCSPKWQLLGNFNAHGFTLSALKFACVCLLNGQQKAKINVSCNSWEDFFFGAL